MCNASVIQCPECQHHEKQKQSCDENENVDYLDKVLLIIDNYNNTCCRSLVKITKLI